MSNIKRKFPIKFIWKKDEMPKEWYNVRADMKNKPAPLLNLRLISYDGGRIGTDFL